VIRRHIYPDPARTAAACAQHITGLLEEARSARGMATLAVSGGSTPKLLFQDLVASGFGWDHIHVFWVDERAVPPGDPQSNFRLAQEALLEPARIPAAQTHRVYAERPPPEAAQQYEQEIRGFFAVAPGAFPEFDVVHLGLGPDAHTASLFPGEPLISDRRGLVAAVWVEKLATWRITLLPGVLLAARQTVFLVAGQDKAQAVHAVFDADYDPEKYPAQTVARHARDVTWFLDEPAASLLPDA
jgi:6-phosphogluconolactonase